MCSQGIGLVLSNAQNNYSFVNLAMESNIDQDVGLNPEKQEEL